MVSETTINAIAHESAPLIYSAPSLPPFLLGASELSVTSHLKLLETALDNETRLAVLFHLGNQAFRRAAYDDAVKFYQLALRVNEDSAELRANLGAGFLLQDRNNEAETHLRRALMLNPALTYPQFHLGLISLASGNTTDANERFLRFRESDPRHLGTLFGLAELANLSGNKSEIRAAYEAILQRSPDHRAAQIALARIDFASGRSLLNDGDFEGAVQTWARSYHTHPRPYSADQQIVAEFRSVIKSATERGLFQQELDNFRASFRTAPDDKSPFYQLTLSYLFVHCLIPEYFEPLHSLQQERVRWLESLLTRGEHPYPHYRLALIALYSGDLENALKELSISRDRFPPKKQVVLKVKELFHFLDLIREIQERGDEFRNINLPDYEWEQAGFRDPFTLRAWRETGLAPKDAALWLEAKFSPTRATAWKQAGIEPAVARHWTNADFSEPSDVKAWIRGGFAPEEAKVWRDAHLARDTSPLPMELLVQYRRAGFTDADLVYRWAEVLQVPFEAATWSDLGFTPEDAAQWRDVGFTDAYDAAARRKEFQTADEALKNFRQ